MTPQDYITNRLAKLREGLENSHEKGHIRSRISELEAMQAHLSQSTRPEVSIGGPYSAQSGMATAYLVSPDGFHIAEAFSLDGSGFDTIQRIASDLNQLEALRASHGELYSLLREHEESRSYGGERARRYCLSPLSSSTRQALTKAQSLIHPTKTPTAAPQGQ